jgi:hypothetical protein
LKSISEEDVNGCCFCPKGTKSSSKPEKLSAVLVFPRLSLLTMPPKNSSSLVFCLEDYVVILAVVLLSILAFACPDN